MLLGLTIALIALALDQVSKYVMLTSVLEEQHAIVVGAYFNLVRAWNTGVSFSMFDDHGRAGIYALSLVALAIVAFLLRWLASEKSRLVQAALGLVIGGALGNVIDRLRMGAVFDFLDFHIGVHHWPAFNLADSFICIGAGIIVVHGMVTAYQKKEV